ncbi:hypothetical protein [Vibrio phage vB_VpP_HA7]|uniref:Uncharacterized protein n=2 Tax=Maculvirus TaxID=2731958 RepID=A0A977Q6E0_9CAUD|nr:hypothetical protein [Vibrio phage F23s2]UUW39474.1 hypothetical protein vBVpaP1701_41 [Vibrio phage vB_VpaP_1701]UXF57393.1 hypothetical protein [Vibrio phage vB_VpP_HA5]UXF57440.1 hypothetical protein [Vibrio phage vB_VpP_HA7]
MSKLKQWFEKHAERIIVVALLVGMVTVGVAVGWGLKALELMFYKWALGF